MSPKHRSLGPALIVQKALLRATAETGTLWYDFPARTMMPVYDRLGYAPKYCLVRMSRPLSLRQKFEAAVGNRALARATAAPLDWFLQSRGGPIPEDVEVLPQQGRFEEEFTELARRTAARWGVCAQRSAEYLNWRYRDHPVRKYEALTAHRQGELIAFCIFAQENQNMQIDELFGTLTVDVVAALTSEAALIGRQRGIATISAPALHGRALMAVLGKVGFRPRESAPVLVGDGLHANGPVAPAEWFITNGDRES
jgi:hypothetical protein